MMNNIAYLANRNNKLNQLMSKTTHSLPYGCKLPLSLGLPIKPQHMTLLQSPYPSRAPKHKTMAAQRFIHVFSSLLVILAAIEGAKAVEYTVTNTALATSGGVAFRDKVGAAYAKQTMDSATQFIWRIFQQNSPADRKNVQQVSLFVDDMDGVAYTSNDQIHLSARYVGSYSGDVKKEVTGVLYHEMTHVWQWNGNGQANGGLIEGIADYVRLKAGYAPSHWVKPGQGNKWDQGYDVTAYFLDYCNSLRNGFVAELNEKMRTGYSDDYFRQLLGKPVDQLWRDYKAKYGN